MGNLGPSSLDAAVLAFSHSVNSGASCAVAHPGPGRPLQWQCWPSQRPFPVVHCSHAPPFFPQAVGESPGKHWSSSQQPRGQVLASQTQLPDSHLAPLPQVGPPPQPQAPSRQVFELVGSQRKHVAPGGPQWSNDSSTQTEPRQHPAQPAQPVPESSGSPASTERPPSTATPPSTAVPPSGTGRWSTRSASTSFPSTISTGAESAVPRTLPAPSSSPWMTTVCPAQMSAMRTRTVGVPTRTPWSCV